MRRPWLIRLAPLALRTKLYYALYRSQAARDSSLYASAALALAPGYRMELWPGDEAHGEIAFTGLYEGRLSKRLIAHSREGGLMVDVGANFGYFALLWLAARPTNRVIAFEPVSRNVTMLRRNAAMNGVEDRFDIRAMAVGNRDEPLPFSPGPETQTGWGGFTEKNVDSFVVESVTLDRCLPREVAIDVLKIDAEGADTWVLSGARDLLSCQRIRHIYFEQNDERMRALGIGKGEAIRMLEELGYRVVPLDPRQTSLAEFYATPRERMSSRGGSATV
jgi:FkbM family methyltransferase